MAGDGRLVYSGMSASDTPRGPTLKKREESLLPFSVERAASILTRLIFVVVVVMIMYRVARKEIPGPLRMLYRFNVVPNGSGDNSSGVKSTSAGAISVNATVAGPSGINSTVADTRAAHSLVAAGDARGRRTQQLGGEVVLAAVSSRGSLRRDMHHAAARAIARSSKKLPVGRKPTAVAFAPNASGVPVSHSAVAVVAGAAMDAEAPSTLSVRRFCEDLNPAECSRLVRPTRLDGSERLPDGCQPTSAAAGAFRGNDTEIVAAAGDSPNLTKQAFASGSGSMSIADMCPRTCGLCAVVLSDCVQLALVGGNSSCIVGEDVVGEVCAADGDVTQEGYCTWVHAPQTRFVCARCADRVASPERRAVLAQVTELRLEEDARPMSQLVAVNAASMRERAALTVPR
eukprot:TRINITY_DN21493_c0_g1_i1.p1 TRINITY_DN21493_c0_g1~~TRINITY_DN21493_c0_g1_i1.p1  ORF type:complete len:401 (+),score=71.94 TRINITY_DN21493_c0_g1_i1:58-1260(+)